MTYKEQLLDSRWLAKREFILKRDNHQCQICLSLDELHVHHKTYINSKLAWEYDDSLLITLCADCHAKFHNVPRHRFRFKEDILQIAARCRESVKSLIMLDYKIRQKEEEAANHNQHG